jgi:hydroxypyruvate reductase 1
MEQKKWEIHNSAGSKRVVVTKLLPGSLWLERLIKADCKVEVCTSTDVLSVEDIKAAIGQHCDAVLGQLTEDWGEELFGALKAAAVRRPQGRRRNRLQQCGRGL